MGGTNFSFFISVINRCSIPLEFCFCACFEPTGIRHIGFHHLKNNIISSVLCILPVSLVELFEAIWVLCREGTKFKVDVADSYWFENRVCQISLQCTMYLSK